MITQIVNGVPVTCSGGGSHTWIDGSFKIDLTPNATMSAYHVDIYASINARGNMQWSGDCILRATCNGVSGEAPMSLAMYSAYPGDSGWDGPVSFDFGTPGDTTLTFNLDIDLTSTTGTNGQPGVYHVSDGGNMTHFYHNNWAIDVTGEPLASKPTITSFTNNNKFNNQAGVSASTTSLSLAWTANNNGAAIANLAYRIKAGNGNWDETHWSGNYLGNGSPFTISGLSPGTTYTVQISVSNSAGWSDYANITVRTKHNVPVCTISLASRDLESLTFNWTSDKNTNSRQYSLDGGEWANAGGSGTSGSFTISGLSPKTSHTVKFRVQSTATYDSLWSSEKSASGTTLDISHITAVGTLTFGTDFTVTISGESSKSMSLKIWTEGNGRTATVTVTPSRTTNTISFTQAQWDAVYRTFPNANSMTMRLLLTTIGTKNYNDTQQNKTLTLTGIAKTSHVGVNNAARRVQVWVGDSSGRARRAVTWVGAGGGTHRTI